MSNDTLKTDYADTLNALHDMQRSIAYALRREVLANAEQIILKLERELKSALAAIEATQVEQVTTLPPSDPTTQEDRAREAFTSMYQRPIENHDPEWRGFRRGHVAALAAPPAPEPTKTIGRSIDTPEFREMLWQFRHTDCDQAAKRSEIIAYIDTHNAAPPAPQPTLTDPRMGEYLVKRGETWIAMYIETLESELAKLQGKSSVQSAPAPQQPVFGWFYTESREGTYGDTWELFTKDRKVAFGGDADEGSQVALYAGKAGEQAQPVAPDLRTNWMITAPDGRTWVGASPVRAAAAAQRDTIDPVIALERINAAVAEGVAEDMAELRKVAEAVLNECEQVAGDMVLYTGFDVEKRIRAIDIDAIIEQVKDKS